MRFITEHKERWGVEPICRVLPIAPSTYGAAVNRPPSARAQRDEDLMVAIRRVWHEHRQVSGADTVWAQRNREGVRVARWTGERLMRAMGVRGVAEEPELSARPSVILTAAGLQTSSHARSQWRPRTGSGSSI